LLPPSRPPELLSVLAHNRGGRVQADADSAALVDEGALCGDPPDDIIGCQYRRHLLTALRPVAAGLNAYTLVSLGVAALHLSGRPCCLDVRG